MQQNEIDIGRIVQLPRPALAHGEHGEPGRLRRQTVQRASALGRQRRPERQRRRPVRKVGERRGHRIQRPDPAEVGERNQERGPPLHQAQRSAGLTHAFRRLRGVKKPRERGFGRRIQHLRQPFRLPCDQTGQERTGPGRAFEKIAERPGRVKQRRRFRAAAPVEGLRCGGDPRAERSHRPS